MSTQPAKNILANDYLGFGGGGSGRNEELEKLPTEFANRVPSWDHPYLVA